MGNYEQIIKTFYHELDRELQTFTLPVDELIKTLDFVEISYADKNIAGIAGLRKGHNLFVIVKDRFQNKGIGQQLFQRVIRRALEKGYHYIQLTVYKNNQPAIHIYEKHGFIAISARGDSYFMVKPLSWKGQVFVLWSRFKVFLRWARNVFLF